MTGPPPLLPHVWTRDDYARSPRDAASYIAAARAICGRHGFADAPLAKYAGGSAVVFAVGGAHVLKIYAPPFAVHAETERAALAHVRGRLGVPTPGVVAAGELEGWRYLVM